MRKLILMGIAGAGVLALAARRNDGHIIDDVGHIDAGATHIGEGWGGTRTPAYG